MRIVLTGCNGKLGRACGDLFVARGHEVVGIDAAPAGTRPHPVVVDDLRNPAAIHRSFDKLGAVPDAVVHLANHTNAQSAPAEVVLRENLSMNSGVFLGAAQAGVGRLVFSSSIQAFIANFDNDGGFGHRVPHGLPLSEALEPRPSNVYGVSKLVTERMLDAMCNGDAFRLPSRPPAPALTAASIRLPYILGPQQFDWCVQNTTPSDFKWGGPEAFAWIHVEDAAAAMLAACTAKFARHEVFWVTAPDPRPAESVEQLVAKHFKDVPGSDAAVRLRRLSDCSKAERILGWKPAFAASRERQKRGISPAGEVS